MARRRCLQATSELSPYGKRHVLTLCRSRKFADMHSEGKRVPPQKPGHVLAALAISADPKLSGAFVNWEEESMGKYRG